MPDQDQPESKIIHQKLDTDAENPGIEVAKTVADIEETDVTDLTNTYDCVNGVLTNIFSNPPSKEAQMEVSFSYEGYRITVAQDGTTEFLKID